jgi:beta-glucosidase
LGITSTAVSLEDFFNQFFGTSSVKVVNTSDSYEDTTYFKSEYTSAQELVDAREDLNREVVAEGVVLLKNENSTLPLGKNSKVTAFGLGSVSPVYGGSAGGGIVLNSNQIRSLYQCFTDEGILLNETVRSWYKTTGIPKVATDIQVGGRGVQAAEGTPWLNEPNELSKRRSGVTEVDITEAVAQLRGSYSDYKDAAIVVLSRLEGEGSDMAPGSLTLTAEERAIISEAKDNFGKVIALINTPTPLEIQELKDDPKVGAILWIGYPGTNGLVGVAQVLTGTANPSGHLFDIFAADSTSSPAYQNFGEFAYSNAESAGLPVEGSYYVVNAEGIYVGYKYYETRYEDCILGAGNADSKVGVYASKDNWDYTKEVTYGFGYGLSYTDFNQTLDRIVVDEDQKTVTATVTVTNIGNAAGKNAVEIFVQSPYTDYDKQNKVEKAAVSLLGFGKTKLLNPGEKETVTISMKMKYMASYDYLKAKTYILDSGDYYFAIGNGAHDALNNILSAKGKTIADGMDYDGNASQAYKWTKSQIDTESFSESYANATLEVTNRFDDADYNYFNPNSVQYLSRSDWSGTFPKSYTDLLATEEMIPLLSTEQYVSNASNLSGVSFGSTETDYSIVMMRGLDYDDPLWESLLNQISLEELTNFITQCAEHTPAIQSINYQGSLDGDGPIGFAYARFSTDASAAYHLDNSASDYLKNYSFATNCIEPVLASTFNPQLAERRGDMYGEDSLWTGYITTWSPGVDIHRTPYSGRNFEYFSEDAMLSNIMSANICYNMQKKGGIAGPKHVVLNDQETHRHGLSTFFNEQSVREIQLRAFEGSFVPDEGGSMNAMSSFNRLGIVVACYSKELQEEVMRGEWGFQGYIITDFGQPGYMWAKASLVAGTDAFLAFGSSQPAFSAFGNAYTEALTPQVLLSDSYLLVNARRAAHRILYAYANSNLMNGLSSNSKIVNVTPSWLVALYAINSILAAGALASLILYVLLFLKKPEKQTIL